MDTTASVIQTINNANVKTEKNLNAGARFGACLLSELKDNATTYTNCPTLAT